MKNIRYIIIEDEPAALRRLQRKINEIRPEWACIGTADGLLSGKSVLDKPNYDLIFSDIELSDGNSFDLLRNYPNKPTIFITAYSHYAVKAFEFNSIHYLLKPINIHQLNQALHKYENRPNIFQNSNIITQTTQEDLSNTIISKVGNNTTLLNTNDIAFFYHSERITKAFLTNGKSHLINHNLDALLDFLSADMFFKINRQTIVNKTAITHFKRISSNRLTLVLTTKTDTPLVVSKEKSKLFKEWLTA